jgi:hypothetical protein
MLALLAGISMKDFDIETAASGAVLDPFMEILLKGGSRVVFPLNKSSLSFDEDISVVETVDDGAMLKVPTASFDGDSKDVFLPTSFFSMAFHFIHK